MIIPEPTTTISTRPTTTVTTPTPYETTDIVTYPTTPAGHAPACGPGGYCQKCCIWVDGPDPITGEQGYRAVSALCNCETGEDPDPSAIDTNPWSGLP